jgi:hypothetical protein
MKLNVTSCSTTLQALYEDEDWILNIFIALYWSAYNIMMPHNFANFIAPCPYWLIDHLRPIVSIFGNSKATKYILDIKTTNWQLKAQAN